MVKDRSILVLYTTAVCNLKCRYCYIDKNPALKMIDDILDKSFEGDYYFNFTKKMFPNKQQLKEVQFWGGEPSLRLDRSYYTIRKLIEHYPNLENFMMSTNFTTETFFEMFYGFLSLLGKFPERKFKFHLQLSLDGHEELNDTSRGKGVTKKFTASFDKMLETVEDNLPDNVILEFAFKPTLDSGTINFLQTKEEVLKYFLFFEEFYLKTACVNKKNFIFYPSVPNTACPSPHTKEDGLKFANYCKLTRELEFEDKCNKIFNYYKEITSFIPRNRNDRQLPLTYNVPGFMCGSGRTVVGLLPNNMISVCHNGFVDLIGDYKTLSIQNASTNNSSLDFNLFMESHKSKMCMNEKEFHQYETQIEYFFESKPKARVANIASLINLLAQTKQIDEKYIDRKESLKAAHFIQSATSYCVRDNVGTTGSLFLYPVGLLKLLLNGAKDYIEKGV